MHSTEGPFPADGLSGKTGSTMPLATDQAEPQSEREDLSLARACARGESRAVETFEHRILQSLHTRLTRKGFPEDAVADVLQQLRVKLLVGPTPTLSQYGGRGPLLAWVRAAAVRALLAQQQSQTPFAGLADHSDALLVDDPELAVLQQRDTRHVAAALKLALDCSQDVRGEST